MTSPCRCCKRLTETTRLAKVRGYALRPWCRDCLRAVEQLVERAA